MIKLMAQINLKPLDLLNFKAPEYRLRWKQHFEQFHIASGLSDAAAAKQINMLYAIGKKAETALVSTNITQEERLEYNTVIDKFDSYFKVTRNVIFKRARFNHRV